MRWFDCVYVINLEIRSDRLGRLLENIPTSISNVKIWPAVHGDSTGHPSYWTAGNGAWGCYRSHVNILEDAMQRQYESYLVLEDDACFLESFDSELSSLMDSLPNDWEQIYLGGQLLYENVRPPVKLNKHVCMPYNVNRTHAFGVNQRGYRKLYNHLFDLPFAQGEHIDHHLGRLHESKNINVYVPGKWLVGQDSGKSNISGRRRQLHDFWQDPEEISVEHNLISSPLCVFLESSRDLSQVMHSKGWHLGSFLQSDGLDEGVCKAMIDANPEFGLRCWYEWARRDVIRKEKIIPCLFHPKLTLDQVRKFQFSNFIHIEADSEHDATNQLKGKLVQYW